MARISVKSMSRNQQKAVFANLGKGSSTVSNMTARRESLMRNDLVTETRQDKIDRIMRDNKLTHRQKMDRISRLKNGSAFSSSSVAFEASGSDGRNTTDAPAVKLIYKKVLVKAEKRRLERKAYKEKHPGAEFYPTKKPGVYTLKENGKTFIWKDGKKVKKKDMSYKELIKSGVKLKPNADYDGDGIKNSKDCRPMDKNKQDLSNIKKKFVSGAKATYFLYRSDTPAGREYRNFGTQQNYHVDEIRRHTTKMRFAERIKNKEDIVYHKQKIKENEKGYENVIKARKSFQKEHGMVQSG